MNNLISLLILTLIIELITIFFRFVLKTSSKKNIHKILLRFNLKYFIHFHHGFLGIFLLIISLFVTSPYLLIFSLALILSDAIHHLLVLWPITGNPEFHLIYKNKK